MNLADDRGQLELRRQRYQPRSVEAVPKAPFSKVQGLSVTLSRFPVGARFAWQPAWDVIA